ncbi:MAG: Abortive infection protein [Humibacillus sp.]|nr:Abortive infection protein [Humibacillus sp.]
MTQHGPVAELRAFVNAALIQPVEREHWDAPQVYRRRQVVVVITFIVGSLVLAWALRITPGDPSFYVATVILALVWLVGALVSGPLHAGMGHTRRGDRESRPIVQSLVLGLLLLLIFLVGALAVGRVPFLREPVEQLLDHARVGSFALVLAITFFNGVVEELFFRGALYAALPRNQVLITTVLYALTTVGSGIPLLVLAGTLIGLVTALQRRVTGGFLGPMITHVTWSTGMLVLLPFALDLTR